MEGTHPKGGGGCPGFGCDFPQPHLLLPVCQEAADPLTGGVLHSVLGEEYFCDVDAKC